MKYLFMQSRRETIKKLFASGIALGMQPFDFKFANTMKTRKIPASGEDLPIVGVGTWQTFDVGSAATDREPLKEVLKILVEKGGKVVDSSPMYGRSEAVTGDLAVETGTAKALFMATKVWTSGKEQGIRQMQSSMEKMRVNTMDLMQIHNLVDWRTHLKTLRDWKEQGKIRYIGITHYTTSAFGHLEEIIKTEDIDFVQHNYSIVSREAEKSLLPLAQDKGVTVIINQPYESGSLFRLTKNTELPEWAETFDCQSWGQFFLKFILSHPAVTCVIPGTDNPKHMLDNAGAGFGNLPDSKTREQMADFMRSL